MPLPRVQSLIIKKLHGLGKLSDSDLDAILSTQGEISGSAMEKLLLDEYKISEFSILVAKAKAFNLSPFSGRRFKLNSKSFEKLDEPFCNEHDILPIGVIDEHIVIASANPFDLEITRIIKEKTKCRVSVLLATKKDIEALLKTSKSRTNRASARYKDVVSELSESFALDVSNISEDTIDSEEAVPIIRLANQIIEEAYYSGASDIHIEPQETEARVRVRIDGQCHDKLALPKKVALVLVTRLKVMANMDIAEKRIPQDGRITFNQYSSKGVDIDLRVSTAPLNYGEGIVLRILDNQKAAFPLTALGFSDENLKLYEGLIKRPFGMVLHCGPTGSGKSMSLYAALNFINHPEIVIRTVEDPIEYTQPGLCQMEVKHKVGLTFAVALRSMLRQDPDIILVGEIRDKETASIAVEAALTGHLLFSTLHTNDAATTVNRLTEMGIEPFMVSGSLVCVCAQRLIRRVCSSCRQPHEPQGREKDILEKALGWSGTIYKSSGSGCPFCGRTGYKGRIGVHEIMVNTEELTASINSCSDSAIFKRIAMMQGMKTLHQDSMLKVKDGISTLEEAIANVPPDQEDTEAIREEGQIQQAFKDEKTRERKAKVLEIEKKIKEKQASEGDAQA